MVWFGPPKLGCSKILVGCTCLQSQRGPAPHTQSRLLSGSNTPKFFEPSETYAGCSSSESQGIAQCESPGEAWQQHWSSKGAKGGGGGAQGWGLAPINLLTRANARTDARHGKTTCKSEHLVGLVFGSQKSFSGELCSISACFPFAR